MKKLYLFAPFVLITLSCHSQIVNIPDSIFKLRLVSDLAINTNGDNEIQISEAESYTGKIQIGNQYVYDITGIEAFINITTLRCYNTQITSLDVSNNTKLDTLHCFSNDIGVLDLSNNNLLESLWCDNCSLNELNLSSNTLLSGLSCSNNNLSELDLSNNPLLTRLICSYNQLTTINVASCSNLEHINFSNNQLVDIDFSTCSSLDYLWGNNNLLTGLDLSNNHLLYVVNCRYNQLTSLDISNNPLMVTLHCAHNQLINLDLKNGNNDTLDHMNALWNIDLTCVQVDDVQYANDQPYWDIEQSAYYSTNCELGISESFFSSLEIPNPVADYIFIPGENLCKNVYSLNGTMLLSTYQKEIDLSYFESSVYIIEIISESESKILVKKIFKR